MVNSVQTDKVYNFISDESIKLCAFFFLKKEKRKDTSQSLWSENYLINGFMRLFSHNLWDYRLMRVPDDNEVTP